MSLPIKVLVAAVIVGMGIIGVALAGAGGVGPSLSGLSGWFGPSPSDILTAAVRRGTLAITVTEKGSLESSKNEDVVCEVEGQTQIIMIKPEGTQVTKGEVVCELDSATLRDNLTNQTITTKRAESDLANAKKTFEVAEINVNEYLNGIYPQEIETVEGEIKLAESEQVRSQERLEWSNSMIKIGYVSAAQNTVDRLTLQKAVFSLSQAMTKKVVLQKYTREKMLKELQGEVEKARSDMLAKQATYALETAKEDKLRNMIEKCKLLAPNNGLVVYANETGGFRGNNAPLIEEGATVRERQKIFSLPDINNMQVNVKVHESMVDQVGRGKSARIRVDAAPNQPLTGTVKTVAPLPDPNSFFSSDIKQYTTIVTIDRGLPALRPGMSAEAEILIDRLDDILNVPVQAILEFGGKQHAFVVAPDGTASRRGVQVGRSNTKMIEIRDGLKEGELVALNPRSLMSEQEKSEAFGSSSKENSQGKGWGDAEAEKSKASGSPGAVPDATDGAAQPKAKLKRKRAGGAGGMMDPAAAEQFLKLSPEEQRKQLEERGLPPEAVDRVLERIKGGGGFGGPPGGGPGQ